MLEPKRLKTVTFSTVVDADSLAPRVFLSTPTARKSCDKGWKSRRALRYQTAELNHWFWPDISPPSLHFPLCFLTSSRAMLTRFIKMKEKEKKYIPVSCDPVPASFLPPITGLSHGNTGTMTSQQGARREVVVGRLQRLRKQKQLQFLIRSTMSLGRVGEVVIFRGVLPIPSHGSHQIQLF